MRYLVVGGLACVAHGVGRLTEDVDIAIDTDRENIIRAIRVLQELGYKPRLPVTAEAFADRKTRESWEREKNLIAFALINDDHAWPIVDIMTKYDFDFKEERLRAGRYFIDEDFSVPVLSVDRLLEMKRAAGRTKDLYDIEVIEKILRGKEAES